MQKKHIILGVVGAALLSVLVYILVSRSQVEEYETIDTINAVPLNSEVVIHIPDLEDFITHTDYEGTWEELRKLELMQDFQHCIKTVSEALSEPEIEELLDDAQLTIATKIEGRKNIEYSFIFPLKSSSKKQAIQKFLPHLFKDYQENTHSYSGFELHKLSNSQKNEDYFYAFAKGIFILSTSKISLQDALLQISSNNTMAKQKSFQELKKIASKNDDINIFINGTTFPRLLASGIHKDYARFIKRLTDFTTQVGIDVKIKEEGMLLNGILYTNTDDFFYTNILLNQEPVELQLEESIPANTLFWAALSLSDTDVYLDNYKRYLEQTGDSKSYRNFKVDFKNKTGMEAEKFIYPLIENEIGVVISENYDDRYCIVRTKSKSETEKQLNKLKNIITAKGKNRKEQSLSKHIYKVDKKTSYTLYAFPHSDFALMMWGGLFNEIETNYCTLVDNYLVWGKSQKSLQKYIDQIVRRKTLKHDSFYQDQKDFWVDNESCFTAYIRNKNEAFFKKYLAENLVPELTEKADFLEKFPAAYVQIKQIKKTLYLNGYISYQKTPKKTAKTVWQSRLNNSFSMKPIMVKNHTNNEREIILQDDKNILYLISNKGNILWQKPLNEPIMGTVHQVDVYKNNKLQYLFNTKSKIYLIDRNGNMVTNYPLNLRASATNGLALFDYDKNKNYRIFIATEDKQTYLYNIKGKLITGWQAAKNEHIVKQPIQHFVNKNKDYIAYNDGYRNYILNRRGAVRVMPKKNFPKAEGSTLSLQKRTAKSVCGLFATDTTGLIYFTKLDGNVTTKKVGEFSSKHQFTSYDLNADGANDFIFIDKGELFVFDSSGKELFSHDFETEKINAPHFYKFSSKQRKLGIRAGNEIYLFNSDGSQYSGFPLEGYSDFTIGFINKKAKDFNLFVAGSDDLLFNYSVK